MKSNFTSIQPSLPLMGKLLAAIILIGMTLYVAVQINASTTQQATTTTPRVYAPNRDEGTADTSISPAVFWFGAVDPVRNYADMRVNYDNEQLTVTTHVFDRLLWYDTSPTVGQLAEWDAVTLYLSGSQGNGLTDESYRFVAQINHWQDRENYQAAFRGTAGSWASSSTPFESESGWRADGFNGNGEGRGWTLQFVIPFSSLNLPSPPADGTTWKMAVVAHDRDSATGETMDERWPAAMEPVAPATWADLSFGRPHYAPPPAVAQEVVTVRHGVGGVTVKDAHVGGDTTCGETYGPDFFDGWGDANYAGVRQINIQNQWDIADWPCFSKYYVTFPLDSLSLADDEIVLDAALTMHHFGNAGNSGNHPPSFIQAFTVSEAWDEATITWNNAPSVLENISGTWVDPVDELPDWPGVPYQWNVSRAVAEAYANEQPLRLALYSADSEYHSGKYFSSSDVDDWNADARPTLRILVGRRCDAPAVTCHFGFLPTLIGK